MNPRILLINLIFIFLNPQNNHAEIVKMLEIYGTIVGYNLAVKGKFDENCAATCFLKPDCVVAVYDSNSICVAFPYRTLEKMIITKTKPEDGLFAAFKTNLPTSDPNVCPIESEISPIIHLGRDPIPWIKTSDSTWLFEKCWKDMKMVKRSNPKIRVCMQVSGIALQERITQVGAVSKCVSDRYQLLGTESLEESKWIARQYDWWGDKLPENAGVWINGEVSSIINFRNANQIHIDNKKLYGDEYLKTLIPKTE